jgi:hypothetical protein
MDLWPLEPKKIGFQLETFQWSCVPHAPTIIEVNSAATKVYCWKASHTKTALR